ncbi:hypothetical protein VKT23_017800 [Stygiomarasmius scandens]|uniref:Uncharacterized protein n=1 Tax=Marasmiellus scandens TaxID=2682957 RepID=A0ABR1IV58_9AGAR
MFNNIGVIKNTFTQFEQYQAETTNALTQITSTLSDIQVQLQDVQMKSDPPPPRVTMPPPKPNMPPKPPFAQSSQKPPTFTPPTAFKGKAFEVEIFIKLG